MLTLLIFILIVAVGIRRGTVRTIEKITGTMKLVAQAQLMGTIKRARDHAGFFTNVKAMLDKFPDATPTDGKTDKVLAMLITSNRGLCGSLNSQLVRDAARMPETSGDSPLMVFGDKGATVRPNKQNFPILSLPILYTNSISHIIRTPFQEI